MTFSPQIPYWGEANNQFSEKLYKYHSWLLETGMKNGLISNKNPQFVWDEFIIHSLYFGKIINELKQQLWYFLIILAQDKLDLEYKTVFQYQLKLL